MRRAHDRWDSLFSIIYALSAATIQTESSKWIGSALRKPLQSFFESLDGVGDVFIGVGRGKHDPFVVVRVQVDALIQ